MAVGTDRLAGSIFKFIPVRIVSIVTGLAIQAVKMEGIIFLVWGLMTLVAGNRQMSAGQCKAGFLVVTFDIK